VSGKFYSRSLDSVPAGALGRESFIPETKPTPKSQGVDLLEMASVPPDHF